MNDVALVMKGHPEIAKLRIEVYAPGVPKAETQKRADALRDFLISKGVDGGRIEAVGQGAGASRIDFNVTVGEAPKPPRSARPTGHPGGTCPGSACPNGTCPGGTRCQARHDAPCARTDGARQGLMRRI